MFANRLILITGHYGSGKTTLALNLALAHARAGRRVCLADMDIVNPYFRAAECARPLREAGVTLIAPPFAGTNLDSPALPAQLAAAFDSALFDTAVLDVGGDDTGAAALGAYSARVLAEPGYAHLYVVNSRRPLMEQPANAAALLRQIETAGRVPATAVVANPNLGGETNLSVVTGGLPHARETARLCGLPLACLCAPRALAGKTARAVPDVPVFPMDFWVFPPWAAETPRCALP